jgi:hypothetical protein
VPDLGPALPLIALLVVGAAFAWVLLLTRRVRDLRRRLAGITRGAEGRSLEAILEAHLRRVHEVDDELRTVERRTTALEAQARKAVQRVGLVRFNPFEDTGSNQSFALALLDEDGDGVVVSSLHSRNATRLYVKPVVAGRTETALSAEEAEALRAAQAPRGADRRA